MAEGGNEDYDERLWGSVLVERTQKCTRDRLATLNWLLEMPENLFLQDDSPSASVMFLWKWQRAACLEALRELCRSKTNHPDRWRHQSVCVAGLFVL